MEIIELKNVKKIYGADENKILALNNINLKIEKGKLTSIVGPSGSGKSTLLYCMSGLENTTEGEVIFDKVSINTLNDNEMSEIRKDNMGFIFQNYNLIPFLNVHDNIVVSDYIGRKKPIDKNVEKIANDLGIKEQLKKYPDELSGGQQQRVAIARALISNPKVIFADEPTGNLDSKKTKEVVDILRDISINHKSTVVMVTHDNNIAEVSDNIINIVDGKVT